MEEMLECYKDVVLVLKSDFGTISLVHMRGIEGVRKDVDGGIRHQWDKSEHWAFEVGTVGHCWVVDVRKLGRASREGEEDRRRGDGDVGEAGPKQLDDDLKESLHFRSDDEVLRLPTHSCRATSGAVGDVLCLRKKLGELMEEQWCHYKVSSDDLEAVVEDAWMETPDGRVPGKKLFKSTIQGWEAVSNTKNPLLQCRPGLLLQDKWTDKECATQTIVATHRSGRILKVNLEVKHLQLVLPCEREHKKRKVASASPTVARKGLPHHGQFRALKPPLVQRKIFVKRNLFDNREFLDNDGFFFLVGALLSCFKVLPATNFFNKERLRQT